MQLHIRGLTVTRVVDVEAHETVAQIKVSLSPIFHTRESEVKLAGRRQHIPNHSILPIKQLLIMNNQLIELFSSQFFFFDFSSNKSPLWSKSKKVTSHYRAKVPFWTCSPQSVNSATSNWTWTLVCSEVKCTVHWLVPVKSRDKHQRSRSKRRKRRRPAAQSDESNTTVVSSTLSKDSAVVVDQMLTLHKQQLLVDQVGQRYALVHLW